MPPMNRIYKVPGELLWSVVSRLSGHPDSTDKMLAHKLRLLIEEQVPGIIANPSPPMSEEELQLKAKLLEETRKWYAHQLIDQVVRKGEAVPPDPPGSQAGKAREVQAASEGIR